MRAFILLSTMAMAMVASATSLTGPRALVILDNLDDTDAYMNLWTDLQGKSGPIQMNRENQQRKDEKHDWMMMPKERVMGKCSQEGDANDRYNTEMNADACLLISCCIVM